MKKLKLEPKFKIMCSPQYCHNECRNRMKSIIHANSVADPDTVGSGPFWPDPDVWDRIRILFSPLYRGNIFQKTNVLVKIYGTKNFI
jgi:hypothetical protein